MASTLLPNHQPHKFGFYDLSELSHQPNFQHITYKKFKPCCLTTIEKLSPFNDLMVCNKCHLWIKTFKDRHAFERFLIFSNSFSRSVEIYQHCGYYVAVYASFKGLSTSQNHIDS
ncbi:MAG: hypothetical protein OXC44_05620 [Proteobacteria bacterium]|nr:hypothetical protein [Pseudomonadota bacterium]